jgi:hypothetical protein
MTRYRQALDLLSRPLSRYKASGHARIALRKPWGLARIPNLGHISGAFHSVGGGKLLNAPLAFEYLRVCMLDALPLPHVLVAVGVGLHLVEAFFLQLARVG